jgi:undecaprenyl diphosphate synthase
MTTPAHVAIIMDGNGRWAKARGLPRLAGHRAGVDALRTTVRAASEFGIRYLTVYAFSSENWSRPASEVNDLFGLLRLFIRRDLAELHQANVRVVMIGDRAGLRRDVRVLIEEAESLTCGNTTMTLVIAFNYGSRDELTRAVRRIAASVAAGELSPEAISQATLAGALDTAAIPDPDLVIRTSGEMRLSNFLLWQAAYAEFVFAPVYWPDFGRESLADALMQFAGRERRFGGTVPPSLVSSGS